MGRPGFSRFTTRITHALVGTLVFLTLALGSTAKAAPASPPAHRYLFIIETSRAMRDRAPGVLGAAQDLLNRGFNGQLHRGDQLEVWTFNATLSTGGFPPEEWSPETQPVVAVRLLGFLQGLTYAKQARFDQVLPPLDRLVRDSKLLTVILFTAGQDAVRGTPFDEWISAEWSRLRDQQKKARMPLITVLRASDGVFTTCSVTPSPGAPELPPLAVEPQVKSSVADSLVSFPPITLRKENESVPAAAPAVQSSKAALAEKSSALSLTEPKPALAPNPPVPVSQTPASEPAPPAPRPEKTEPAPVLTTSTIQVPPDKPAHPTGAEPGSSAVVVTKAAEPLDPPPVGRAALPVPPTTVEPSSSAVPVATAAEPLDAPAAPTAPLPTPPVEVSGGTPREDALYLVVLVLASAGAAFSFFRWFRTHIRRQAQVPGSPVASEPDPSHGVIAKRQA